MAKTVRAMALLLMLAPRSTLAATTYLVEPRSISDQKAVFATIESPEIEPARVRTGGTVTTLSVKDGDWVKIGQVLATITDQKLILQRQSLEAQILGLQAQLAQAQTDLARAQALIKSGAVSKAQLDQLATAVNVATNQLKSRNADHAVVVQRLAEGDVLAPTDGRVLTVSATVGAFMMSGETVATVAEQNFVLRLQIPETYARFIKAGDSVRIADEDLAKGGASFGAITLVYPQISNGRVVADAKVSGLGDYFVGERIRVWISAGLRTAFIVPASYVFTRFGLDYVKARSADGSFIDVPVQRGQPFPRPDMPDGIEILSGLGAGDVLEPP